MADIAPVVFTNRQGLRLFGVLHLPEYRIRKNTAVILLSPGVKMRVAPHRMYNQMAQTFSDIGFPVLRFDFAGLGDSEGEIEERMLADLYGSIQVGRYIDDTISAMDWLEKEHHINKVVLAGLCGGAITGLLTGATDKRMKGLLSLGIPVILDSANADHLRYITDGQLRGFQGRYFAKLLNAKAWVRFLTFKSDYRTITKVLGRFAKSLLFASDAPPGKKVGNIEAISGATTASNFNPHFPIAFFRVLEDAQKVCLIFSGNDRLLWEFREKFETRWQEKLKRYDGLYQTYSIDRANHILAMKSWKEEMLVTATMWLKSHFS